MRVQRSKKHLTSGRRLHNKGRQEFSVLTVNDRVRLVRRRWHSRGEGTTAPIGAWLDAAEETVSMVTDEENRSRRQKIRQKRRQRGKKASIDW